MHYLVEDLRRIAGRRHVLTGAAQTEPYRTGWRSGEGEALAVVKPGSLVQLWRILQCCVAADAIVILQAQKTGLTEGSTPKGHYDRAVVIVSTLRLATIHLLDGGRQIVSLPGGTLHALERRLDPLGRAPHSVIGSSCIGASIVGGVCNSSGGALVRRGPAYTEQSLFAQMDAHGELRLVNRLGIDLGTEPVAMLQRLEAGRFWRIEAGGVASDPGYAEVVRDVDAKTPGRFNADPRALHDASGSAGRIAVFAVRLDTFAAEEDVRTYYVGANDTGALTDLRRGLLTELDELPILGEYLHRDCFNIAHSHGKDTLLMIRWLGTSRMPAIFAMKEALDARIAKIGALPRNLLDRVLQWASRAAPEALPKRMLETRDRYEHHLILKVAGQSAERTEEILTRTVGRAAWFECAPEEASAAMLHRFAAAGAAARYAAVTRGAGALLPLDIALRRDDRTWFETLPSEIEDQVAAKLYYGHFLCHVFHQDYVLKADADPGAVKAAMLQGLDARGAEYPAEHNVGHLYAAKPALRDHYRALDPCNMFNPGIGKTPRGKHWQPETPEA